MVSSCSRELGEGGEHVQGRGGVDGVQQQRRTWSGSPSDDGACDADVQPGQEHDVLAAVTYEGHLSQWRGGAVPSAWSAVQSRKRGTACEPRVHTGHLVDI